MKKGLTESGAGILANARRGGNLPLYLQMREKRKYRHGDGQPFRLRRTQNTLLLHEKVIRPQRQYESCSTGTRICLYLFRQASRMGYSRVIVPDGGGRQGDSVTESLGTQ